MLKHFSNNRRLFVARRYMKHYLGNIGGGSLHYGIFRQPTPAVAVARDRGKGTHELNVACFLGAYS